MPSSLDETLGLRLAIPKIEQNHFSSPFLGFYLSSKIIADLLAWHVIPQERHHFLFDMGILLSILFGWMLVVLPAVIRQSRFNG